MHPLVEHVSDWFASPLWCHVADTFDSHEVKAVVALDITTDLAIGQPWAPLVNNVPVQTLDPLLGAVSWNCTIGVSRVEHHPVLVLEDRVDPDGSLGLAVVAEG